jgi:hypothetical protein
MKYYRFRRAINILGTIISHIFKYFFYFFYMGIQIFITNQTTINSQLLESTETSKSRE